MGLVTPVIPVVTKTTVMIITATTEIVTATAVSLAAPDMMSLTGNATPAGMMIAPGMTTKSDHPVAATAAAAAAAAPALKAARRAAQSLPALQQAY